MCNQLLLQFSMDHFETMHTCCGYIEDVYVNFYHQGALSLAPVCLSVHLSIRHALWYRVCVINSFHSFKWIFLKPCLPVVDILKIACGFLVELELILTNTAFRT